MAGFRARLTSQSYGIWLVRRKRTASASVFVDRYRKRSSVTPSVLLIRAIHFGGLPASCPAHMRCSCCCTKFGVGARQRDGSGRLDWDKFTRSRQRMPSCKSCFQQIAKVLQQDPPVCGAHGPFRTGGNDRALLRRARDRARWGRAVPACRRKTPRPTPRTTSLVGGYSGLLNFTAVWSFIGYDCCALDTPLGT